MAKAILGAGLTAGSAAGSAAGLAAALLALCACAPSGGGASTSANPSLQTLEGTSWTVTAIDGEAPVAGRGSPSIVFDEEGGAAGSTGCNRFSTQLSIGEGGALSFGGPDSGIVTTRMACAPDLNSQERRMIAALGEAAGYAVDAQGRLALLNAAGEVVVEAEPMAGDEG